MLLCIAPSPDDKRIYIVPHYDTGSVLRASEVQRHVSGKGVNAARAASTGGNEVTLGWKGEVRPAGVLQIGLLENVATFDNSPDFGIHVSYTQRF